jgi:hypothetical protein
MTHAFVENDGLLHDDAGLEHTDYRYAREGNMRRTTVLDCLHGEWIPQCV